MIRAVTRHNSSFYDITQLDTFAFLLLLLYRAVELGLTSLDLEPLDEDNFLLSSGKSASTSRSKPLATPFKPEVSESGVLCITMKSLEF